MSVRHEPGEPTAAASDNPVPALDHSHRGRRSLNSGGNNSKAREFMSDPDGSNSAAVDTSVGQPDMDAGQALVNC